MTVVVAGVVLVALLAGAVAVSRRPTRSARHSIDRQRTAMDALSAMSARLGTDESVRPRPVRQPGEPSPGARPIHAEPGRNPAEPGRTTGEAGRTTAGLASIPVPGPGTPSIVSEAARIVGVWEPPGGRDPAVEANARLTGTTGLVLIVLLFAEGATIPFIARLLSWHIVIGLVLVPPLLVKIGSTLWRFGRYYLGDPRFRRAGPPHPFLRVLGPLLMISTVLLMGSGIALWLAGPQSRTLFRIHQLTFVAWFAFVAVHVVSHLLRATRLAAADSRDAGARRPVVRGATKRRTLVMLSVVVGLGVGLAGRTVTTGWSRPPVVSRVVPTTPRAAGPARSVAPVTVPSTG